MSELDKLPLWSVFIITLAIVCLSIEAGFRLGRYYRKHNLEIESAPVASMVGATLGLLAFMLAFTFGIATDRFNTQKSLILKEANAIGTTYLRSALFSPENQENIQNLLARYTASRIIIRNTPAEIQAAIDKSKKLQDQLWLEAVRLGKEHPQSIMVGLFIDSLNEMIDIHTERVSAGLLVKFPKSMWLFIYVITILSMTALGYSGGLVRQRNIYALLFLSFAFSTVILLIADLNHAHEGLIRVNQEVLIELREELQMGLSRGQ